MGAEHSSHAHREFSHASRSLSHATDDIFGCCDAKKVEPMGAFHTTPMQAHQKPAKPVHAFKPASILNPEGKWVPIPRGSPQEIEDSLPVVDHPQLSLYFITLLKATDPAKMDTSLPTSRVDAESLSKLKIHAVAAFRHHDLDGNGVLEGDESKVFFAHYVECLMAFVQSSMTSAFKQRINIATTKVYQDDLQSEVNKQTAEYNREKRKRFTAAFAVVDVNRDGRLEEKEVVDALTPGHRTNVAFHEALGLFLTHIKVRHRHGGAPSGQQHGHDYRSDAPSFSRASTMPTTHHERDENHSSAHHMHHDRNSNHNTGHHGSPTNILAKVLMSPTAGTRTSHRGSQPGSPIAGARGSQPGSPIAGVQRTHSTDIRHSQDNHRPVAARESSDWGDIIGGFEDLHRDYHHHRRSGRAPNKNPSGSSGTPI